MAAFLPYTFNHHRRDKPPACCLAFFTWVPGTLRQWQAYVPAQGVGPWYGLQLPGSELGGRGGTWGKLGECCLVDSAMLGPSDFLCTQDLLLRVARQSPKILVGSRRVTEKMLQNSDSPAVNDKTIGPKETGDYQSAE